MDSTLFAPPSYPAAMHDPGRAFAASLAQAAPATASPSMPSTRTTDPIVTGASVLAIRYQGGVAIAADTLASYGSLARYRDVRRIKAVGSYSIVGASGTSRSLKLCFSSRGVALQASTATFSTSLTSSINS